MKVRELGNGNDAKMGYRCEDNRVILRLISNTSRNGDS